MENTGSSPRPIFIVGSPRSGTSILTWCLGQHPNILPLEEGNWLDKFAFDLGSTYECGSKRGEKSQLTTLGIRREEFYQSFGRSINDLILNSRARYVEHMHLTAKVNPTQIHPSFGLMREESEKKSRWADGTPEYSLCIYGLLMLFPEAKFIHVVRDVRSVVKSLVRFGPDGEKLVRNEREAYEYWQKTTRACACAEKTFGSARIHRVRYVDLVEKSMNTFKGIFNFLGEPFCSHCLEPLAMRINSSQVPDGFESTDGSTPNALFEEAELLSDQLQRGELIFPSVQSHRMQLESDFWDRVKYIGNLDAELEIAIRNYLSLEKEFMNRTKWAQELVMEVAARDETIRRYQDELKRRTMTNGLWRLGHFFLRGLLPRTETDNGKPVGLVHRPWRMRNIK
jgi:hypothetical protein